MNRMQKLAHDGTDGLDLLEASGLDEVLVIGPDKGVVARGAQRGHEEGHAQVAVAGLGQLRFSMHAGPGVVDPRIETGRSDPWLRLLIRG